MVVFRIHQTLIAVLLAHCVIISFAFAVKLADFSTLADKSRKFVVHITTKQNPKQTNNQLGPQQGQQGGLEDFLKRFYGQTPAPQEKNSLGSGFIISSDGYIVTNHHVIQSADEVEVSLDDLNVYSAKVIGSDAMSDIALLKIDAKNLPYAKLGNSSVLKPGEWVVAIGSPFGFDYTVTKGIISAISRSVGNVTYTPFIQTDVPTNPGNSGGPLINLEGEVIGVNSMIYSRTGTYSGVSLAIPINTVKSVVKQLRANKKVIRGWLGVAIQTVNKQLADSFGLKKPEGALVSSVVKDSPAERAGLQTGDVILRFNKKKINRAPDLPPIVGGSPVNVSLSMTVFRDGKTKKLRVKLDVLKKETLAKQSQFGHNPNSTPNTFDFYGMITVKNPKGDGLLVQQVSGAVAQKAKIFKGDIILKIGNKQVNSIEAVRKIASKLKPGRYISLLIRRGGNTRFVSIRVPK